MNRYPNYMEEQELLNQLPKYLVTDTFSVDKQVLLYDAEYDTWNLFLHIKIVGRNNLLPLKFVIDRYDYRVAQDQTRFMIDFVHHIYESVGTRVYQILNPKRPVKHSAYRRCTKYSTVKYKPKKGHYLVKRKKGK